MYLKHELQSIISGIGDHSAEDLIKAAAHYIRESQKTSGNTENSEFTKKQETKMLSSNSNTPVDYHFYFIYNLPINSIFV
jgi:hypothetical protein